ncbi:MAG TPA: CAP domain-containing protein [Burkholderiaceae bacterium]|nr:CAP domain-containing protein [Burkholderiaceae bacterium]
MQSSRYIRASLACGLLAIALLAMAHADPLAVVNAARGQACGSRSGALAHTPALDTAAHAVADGKSLRAAVEASGYRAVNSAVLRFDGVRDDNELAILVNRSCTQIAAAGLRDAGSYQRGQAFWIVIAEPFSVPKLDQATVAARVLVLVNRARSQPRRCGNEQFGAAPALSVSPALTRAATAHVRDMAERGSMSHAGRDGSTPAQRVTRAGYAWSAVGENIAAGQRDADSVVKSWLGSPGHCANLMSSDYSETGSAFATNAGSEAGIYWTQVFAAPSAPASR